MNIVSYREGEPRFAVLRWKLPHTTHLEFRVVPAGGDKADEADDDDAAAKARRKRLPPPPKEEFIEGVAMRAAAPRAEVYQAYDENCGTGGGDDDEDDEEADGGSGLSTADGRVVCTL